MKRASTAATATQISASPRLRATGRVSTAAISTAIAAIASSTNVARRTVRAIGEGEPPPGSPCNPLLSSGTMSRLPPAASEECGNLLGRSDPQPGFCTGGAWAGMRVDGNGVGKPAGIQHHPPLILGDTRFAGSVNVSAIRGHDHLQPIAELPTNGAGEHRHQRLTDRIRQRRQRVENFVNLCRARCGWNLKSGPRKADLRAGFEPTLRKTRDDANGPLAGTICAGAGMNARVGIENKLNYGAAVGLEFAHNEPIVLGGLTPVDAARRIAPAVRPHPENISSGTDLAARYVPLPLPRSTDWRNRTDGKRFGPHNE